MQNHCSKAWQKSGRDQIYFSKFAKSLKVIVRLILFIKCTYNFQNSFWGGFGGDLLSRSCEEIHNLFHSPIIRASEITEFASVNSLNYFCKGGNYPEILSKIILFIIPVSP